MTVICFTYIGHGYYSSVSHSGFPAAIWAEGSVWLAVDKSRVARLSHEKWVSGYVRLADSNVHDIIRRVGLDELCDNDIILEKWDTDQHSLQCS